MSRIALTLALLVLVLRGLTTVSAQTGETVVRSKGGLVSFSRPSDWIVNIAKSYPDDSEMFIFRGPKPGTVHQIGVNVFKVGSSNCAYSHRTLHSEFVRIVYPQNSPVFLNLGWKHGADHQLNRVGQSTFHRELIGANGAARWDFETFCVGETAVVVEMQYRATDDRNINERLLNSIRIIPPAINYSVEPPVPAANSSAKPSTTASKTSTSDYRMTDDCKKDSSCVVSFIDTYLYYIRNR